MRRLFSLSVYALAVAIIQAEELVELRDGWQVVYGELLSPLSFPDDAPEAVFPQRTPLGQPTKKLSTWRIRIEIVEKDRAYGFILPDIYSAYTLFLDGRLVGGNGIASESSGSAVAEVKRRSFYALPMGSTLEVLLQVSNHNVAGDKIRTPILLGSAAAVAARHTWETGSDLLIMAFLVLAGLAMLTLPETLHSASVKLTGGFLLALALRFSVLGDRLLTFVFPNIGFETLSDIGYITASLAACLLVLSLVLRFQNVINQPLAALVVVGNLAAILPVAILPTLHFPPWSFFFELGLALAIVWVLVLPLGLFLTRVPHNPLFWVSLAFIPLTVFLDLLVHWRMLQGTSSLPLGVAIFAVGQVATLAMENTRVESEEKHLLVAQTKALRARSQFLERFQHHLRTPLHGALDFLERVPVNDPDKPIAMAIHAQVSELKNSVNEGLEAKETPPDPDA